MKILDIPQVGKLGLTVTWKGRTGQLRRILVTPKNPRTDSQLKVRQTLQEQARAFDGLTQEQQDAWNTAALAMRSSASLGQSGPLTGFQLFVRINCKPPAPAAWKGCPTPEKRVGQHAPGTAPVASECARPRAQQVR